MDNLKFTLSALACAYFPSLIWLIQYPIHSGPVMLILYYSQEILYLLLYLIACVGLVLLVKKLKNASDKWYYSLPLIITIIALTFLTIIIVLISAMTMKFPYTLSIFWLLDLHNTIKLLLIPSCALLLVALRPFINEYFVIFMTILIGLCLFEIIGEYLFWQIHPSFYFITQLAITLSGLLLLILASGYTKNTPQ